MIDQSSSPSQSLDKIAIFVALIFYPSLSSSQRRKRQREPPDADDEFAFRLSLPEFAALNIDARSSLSSLLCQVLQGVVTHTDDDYECGNDDVNDTHDDDDDHNNIREKN